LAFLSATAQRRYRGGRPEDGRRDDGGSTPRRPAAPSAFDHGVNFREILRGGHRKPAGVSGFSHAEAIAPARRNALGSMPLEGGNRFPAARTCEIERLERNA